MVPDPRRRPVVAVAAVALAVEAFTALRLYARLGPGERPVLFDSVIFEYHGWWLARGRRLYVDLWEVKPPVAFEVTTALALVAPDPVTYHALAVAVTVGATVATCVLAAAFVLDRTGDGLAALAAGVGPLAVAGFVTRGLVGFKAKPLVAALVLAALVADGRDSPCSLASRAASPRGRGSWPRRCRPSSSRRRSPAATARRRGESSPGQASSRRSRLPRSSRGGPCRRWSPRRCSSPCSRRAATGRPRGESPARSRGWVPPCPSSRSASRATRSPPATGRGSGSRPPF
ncbi:DolP-mannose mannosyltransferase [Halosegnis marinus]|uniref:DolP-mannose mannosyltransferase n=1 Tax=Halosegnis marinus TaxID=3034023 RepID=UPI00361381F0